jgi:hypothetical protein
MVLSVRCWLDLGESPGWWAGSLAERTGLTGVAEDEAVQRLFAGQDPMTGEQRVAPLWRADPRSRLDAGPLKVAVEICELATGERPRKQLQRISGTRKVSAAVVERLCRQVSGRNPEELYDDASWPKLQRGTRRAMSDGTGGSAKRPRGDEGSERAVLYQRMGRHRPMVVLGPPDTLPDQPSLARANSLPG